MAATTARRSSGPRLILALAVLTLAALTVVPVAGAEQGGSQLRRLPFGFLDSGNFHTCAILDGGSVRCWGLGNDGRLGYANTTTIGDNEVPSSVGPVDLGLGRTALALSAGSDHTCAILNAGAVRCWGYNFIGQLGYGLTDTIGDNETPGSIGPVDIGTGRTATQIASGDDRSCVILDNGRVRCWGDGTSGQLGYGNPFTIGDNETPASAGPVDLGAGRKAVAITAGTNHTCAILDNGRVRCWGIGSSGQLGTGNADSIGDNETPASIPAVNLGTGRKAVAVSAGSDHTCAILDTGKVRCWGYGGLGQLGYGNIDWIGDNETPNTVPTVNLGAGRTAVALGSGSSHTCAILDTGKVRCWGNGSQGELGYANTSTIGDTETPNTVGPVSLGAGRTAVAIGGGSGTTCALLDNGAVRCWGANGSGQLGYGDTTSIGDNETPAAAGPVLLGGFVATKLTPALTLALSRSRDRVAPFGFRASGKLSGFLVDPATCSGFVAVGARKGTRAIVHLVRLHLGAAGCTYAAAMKVTGRGRWTVTARFASNGSLKSRTSTARTFRAG